MATLALIGYTAVNRLKDGLRRAKLEKDVQALNSALNLYEAEGGSVVGLVLPQQVLDKMKGSTADALAVGTDGILDPRVRAVMADDDDSGLARAVWNPGKNRFEMGSAGVGVKAFALDAPIAVTVDEGRHVTVAYGTGVKGAGGGAEVVAARKATGGRTATPASLDATQLPLPLFSIAAGTFPAAEYPMSLRLSIPVSYAGTARIMYQVNGGTWNVYDRPLALTASASTTITAYLASTARHSFSDGAHLAQTYIAHFDDFSGRVAGRFRNAAGADDATDIEVLADGHRLEWGKESASDGSSGPSHMTFEGAAFTGIAPEEEFFMGTLTFRNGTQSLNTAARTAELNATLTLASAGLQEELKFGLGLKTTPDRAWQSADQAADSVRLENNAAQLSTVLNGKVHYLVLRFGECTPNGFTTRNELHVNEGATASGNIYGRLTATPPGRQPASGGN